MTASVVSKIIMLCRPGTKPYAGNRPSFVVAETTLATAGRGTKTRSEVQSRAEQASSRTPLSLGVEFTDGAMLSAPAIIGSVRRD